ncbi:BREX-1 system adenine-specific DNA-methyltransferase PglX [Spongiibacter sp. KMU-158]|uniref:site-specific DNA-methyltransferase (adenine-specific) n=1 Tax=Spongiibacter pelagi TaxID=2760804 RepID=A0A927GX32_9GAMM|nr:BREX-1 system adenine-specific DNA-methyltransferase PglX [Spongiibacter pelagi]MBD2860090.1 BREX-1 system adenine-specific DNA-methyltransferase PglX [Spongiibacter pelagi]
MNKSALKKYAPQARLDFIAAVTRRAELLGLNPKSPAKVEKQGEALLINGKAFPAAYGQMRSILEARIRDQGFAQVMEAMAYTWFNRLVAIRYMELQGFLDHDYRVLSHPANAATGHTQPEILDHIADLELPGLNKPAALELKLAGNKDEELYREVLLAQCHALHNAMPFLFESLDDATELLLPDGLLRTDSLLAPLVTKIDEADWQEVEIIGWLYQFYISEKKDQVIGKVVKSEDIPAATQLFTPNWIVKYLVQNSLGRLWLMANPTSQLATKWEYYIKPAEQTDEVNAQLDALIQARIDEDGATLNPESLTLLDPACGSGHILVEAFELLRDIYLERGYRRQDIPRLILEKNLYGLDIDDRAAQLAGFALLMKARADDRRLFGQPVSLNVLALQEAKEGSAADLHNALNAPQIDSATVIQLVETFDQAKTFGSLIQVPDELANALPDLRRELEAVREGGDMLGRDAAETLLRLVAQAEVLAKQFDAVVANPPYMGNKYLNPNLKAHLKAEYKGYEKDLFSAFMIRDLAMTKPAGQLGFMSPFVWMFISSYEELRSHFIERNTLTTLVQLEYSGFAEATVPICTFTLSKAHVENFTGSYVRLSDFRGSENQGPKTLEAIRNPDCGWFYTAKPDDFKKIPGSPVAYWLNPSLRESFVKFDSLGELADLKQGMSTTDSDYFVRNWSEVDYELVAFGCSSASEGNKRGCYWFPFNKGGKFRKWYGNVEQLVRYEDDGAILIDLVTKKYPNISDPEFVIKNRRRYFRESVTYSAISSSNFGVRLLPKGSIFSIGGPVIQSEKIDNRIILALMLSPVANEVVSALSPTLNFQAVDLEKIPVPDDLKNGGEISNSIKIAVEEIIAIHKADWDAFEASWDFQGSPLVCIADRKLHLSFDTYFEASLKLIARVKDLEEIVNKKIIASFGLSHDVGAEVSEGRVTLFTNPIFRYGMKLNVNELREKFRNDTLKELIAYTIGCMMGRYSLDAPGLIYAHAGNEGFDLGRYQTYPADDDGIVPITDEAWFDDDGANRIREFVRVVWGEDTEAENMAWLAESLGSKASESADDTIRRYLSRDFYKDHLQTYKKRPIYWLFSSGKHKAFEALVYLHRYNAGTLSRMRMEYVVPLQSRMQARIDNLEQDIQSSTSSAEQKRFQKQKDKLVKQLDELRRFDENLRHYADQRITLDLDDGVKVNYGKFGDLLAEVKAVTGKKG